MEKHVEGTVPIPEPEGAVPLLGHVKTLDKTFPYGSMMALSRTHGEVYRLRFPGRSAVFVSTHAIVNETCDETRFIKAIGGILTQVRNGINDGLFTARDGEENWGIAHPLKWARFGSDTPIAVTEDFTRLTLDTLALCSMGYRFNSYYSPTLHPFITAMGDFLTESGERLQRIPLPSFFYRARDEKGVLDERKAAPSGRKDLLSAMLNGVDSKTGKSMTDDSIMDNLITFLIAGHETTAGLLSFAMYQLLKNPDAYAKAQREVDSVLPYTNAVLRETLRCNSPITTFAVEAREDTLLAGKYPVRKGEPIVNFLSLSHLDPKVFGEDADQFRPERMTDGEFERLNREFPNCWKPFGNGMRGCIGRAFAWQEALLVMTMILQNFNFVLDPGYTGALKQTLTIKPKDMHFRAILRDGLTPTTLEHRLAGTAISRGSSKKGDGATATATPSGGVPLTILFGSNSGTCEALAQRVASDAPSHGFHVSKVDCMDSGKGSLPTNHPVIIVTPSYEGEPADNAGHFIAWLKEQAKTNGSLSDVSYAVFGCGHRDWVQTFHSIPKLVDAGLAEAGATRVATLGLSDTFCGTTFTDFETWEDEALWPALKERYSTGATADEAQGGCMTVEVLSPRTSALRQDVQNATVVETRSLTTGAHEKRHIEMQLPEGMTYKAGDYLAVLPLNPENAIHRVMRRLNIPRDAHLSISSDRSTSLPLDVSVPATDILGGYVELSQPATKRNIITLTQYTPDEETKAVLNLFAGDGFADVTTKRISVLDLLERFPSIDIDTGAFLSMLPPVRVRQYSISSSPLWNPRNVTLTYPLLDGPSHPSPSETPFQPVTTTYLSTLRKGDQLNVAVRPSQASFHLPPNGEETPIICVAAGEGIAPFRGFVQERAAMISGGRELAPAILFFGCRSAGDDLYREELDEWERAGAVEVRRAYSREGGARRHVRDRLWEERGNVSALWERGAKVFVCGSRGVADGVRETFIRIRSEVVVAEGLDEDSAGTRKWFESLRNVRYVTDVFE